jgi:hypothetical protein
LQEAKWRAARNRARMTQLDEPGALPPDVEPMALWRAAVAGSHAARERLLEMCYSELRTLARRMLAGDSIACRLQPTDLANEAALRVLKLDHMQWNDRAHFLGS